MENRFKLVIYNKFLYQEIELVPECHKMKIGTTLNSDVRLRKEFFFDDFYCDLVQEDETWNIYCSDNTYIDSGDVRKVLFLRLVHGENILIRYKDSNGEIIKLTYLIDFDYKEKKYDCIINIPKGTKLTLGSLNSYNIFLNSKYAKKDRIILTSVNDKLELQILETTYGVYRNGNLIEHHAYINDYDFFSIAEFYFYYKNNKLYTDSLSSLKIQGLSYVIKKNKDGYLYPKFNLNTRIKTVLPNTPIMILDPPERPEKPKNNLLLSIMPAFIMLILTIVIRGFMNNGGGTFVLFSICSISLGIITSIITYIQGNKEYKRSINNRIVDYKNYIDTKCKEIENYRSYEKKLLEQTYPDVQANIDCIMNFSENLFDRVRNDEDFLHVRIGTGTVKAVREIQYKEQERFATDDDLVYLPGKVADEYRMIEDCPVTIDLKSANAVGIIGDEKSLLEFSRNITIDLSVRQYFRDLKMVYIFNEQQKDEFQWIRFLPHIQSDGPVLRNIAYDKSRRTSLYEDLYKELSWRTEHEKTKHTSIVIHIFDEEALMNHPLSKFIENASNINVSFIFYVTKKIFLPLWCSYIISISKDQGNVVCTADRNQVKKFYYQPLNKKIASEAAKKLGPIFCEEVNLEGSLAKSITLFDLLGIYSIEDLNLSERWNQSQICKSMAAPLGIKAKREMVYLDIHEKAHGPHGLVAGTTGSGKSEILQSYILSLSTLFHPYEVGFVLIDFKGGGMANQFSKLPHLLGTITNIDGRQINRSLQSIKAELLKRQTYFAQAEVNHIDKYINLYKQKKVDKPLPHLIIIVDEFAELKAEHPDFMKELISAARIGRSLGVHLILATQKPSGQVNEQIWSNSRFKLCLKVQSVEDSKEMIRSPLAAEIVEPGRAYFQVGNNEIFELFQSGYSGAPEKTESSTYNTKSFRINKISFEGCRECVYERKSKEQKTSRSQLEAIVDYVNIFCENSGIGKLSPICLPPLSNRIEYPQRIIRYSDLENIIPIGMIDDPQHQSQDVALLNLTQENTMIIGAPQYGKTNLLQVIIRGISETYTPDEVNIYIIDFGTLILRNFEELPHVGGVVSSNEDEKFKNLIKMINDEIVLRREKFSIAGVTSLSSYRESGKYDIPQLVLLIDNFTAVRELYLQEEDIILPLCRDGIAYGISVILSNQTTSGLGYRYLSAFSKRFAFTCNETSEYSSVMSQTRLYPESIPGRAITEIENEIFELQCYISFKAEREVERIQQMREYVENIKKLYPGKKAKKIPEIPPVLTENVFLKDFSINRNHTYSIPVGLLYEDVSVKSIDLLSQIVFSIIGKEKSGKKNLINVIMKQLYNNMFECPVEIYILDNVKKDLTVYKDLGIVREYTIDSSDVISIVENIYDTIYQRWNDYATGMISDLFNEALQIVIINNNDALEILSKNAQGIKQYKEIIGKYKSMKVCFIFLGIENVPIQYNAPEILKSIKEVRNIFFFDDLANLKICDVPSTLVRKYKKKITAGDCYWISGNDFEKMKTVLSGKER